MHKHRYKYCPKCKEDLTYGEMKHDFPVSNEISLALGIEYIEVLVSLLYCERCKFIHIESI